MNFNWFILHFFIIHYLHLKNMCIFFKKKYIISYIYNKEIITNIKYGIKKYIITQSRRYFLKKL